METPVQGWEIAAVMKRKENGGGLYRMAFCFLVLHFQTDW